MVYKLWIRNEPENALSEFYSWLTNLSLELPIVKEDIDMKPTDESYSP